MSDGSESDTDSDDSRIVLLATDGSDLATAGLRRGLALLHTDLGLVVVTVTPTPDMSMVVGTGMAGGVMSFEEKEALLEAQAEAGRAQLDDTVAALELGDAETVVLQGDPAHEICRLADERNAAVIVLGTRGHGGFRRAVLGSVSDHVVRHAPCPVLTIGET